VARECGLTYQTWEPDDNQAGDGDSEPSSYSIFIVNADLKKWIPYVWIRAHVLVSRSSHSTH